MHDFLLFSFMIDINILLLLRLVELSYVLFSQRFRNLGWSMRTVPIIKLAIVNIFTSIRDAQKHSSLLFVFLNILSFYMLPQICKEIIIVRVCFSRMNNFLLCFNNPYDNKICIMIYNFIQSWGYHRKWDFYYNEILYRI